MTVELRVGPCRDCGETVTVPEGEPVVHDGCTHVEYGESYDVPEPDEDEEPGPDYYHGPEFQTIREDVLDRDGWECSDCGMPDDEHRRRDDMWPYDGGLHVHHLTDPREFAEPQDAHTMDNLVTLCAECHRRRHW